jgi:hypothetical protein
MDFFIVILTFVISRWTLPLNRKKTYFSGLNKNKWLIHFSGVLQITDSGSKLAAIVSIAGISLPLQLKTI